MNKEELKARTKQFALQIFKLFEKLPKTFIGRHIGYQLFKAGSSVGANYRSACWARSKAEFIAKTSVVLEEADESLYWLEIINDSKIYSGKDMEVLMKEADELTAIFSSILKASRNN